MKSEEFDALAVRYFCGEADDSERERLLDAVQDPERRRALVALARVHGQLATVHVRSVAQLSGRRALAARIRPGRGLVIRASLLAAAASVMLGWFLLRTDVGNAVASPVAENAIEVADGAGWHSLAADGWIDAVGDGLRARYPDGSTLILNDGRAHLGLDQIELTSGRISCVVTPRERKRFTIVTGQAVVSVRGTHYTVTASENATHVAVEEGLVTVSAILAAASNRAVELPAGTSARMGADGSVVVLDQPWLRASAWLFMDSYADEGIGDAYMLAAYTAGELDLAGVISSPSRKAEVSAEATHHVRQGIIDALAPGVPHAMGTNQVMQRPASGRWDQTARCPSAATDLIIKAAQTATAERPLVLVVPGSALTAIADAILAEPAIAERIIVATFGNAEAGLLLNYDRRPYDDLWAAGVVAERVRMVLFDLAPWQREGGWPRLAEMPGWSESTLPIGAVRSWLVAQRQRLILDAMYPWMLLRSEHIVTQRRLAPGPWDVQRGARTLVDDPQGTVWRVAATASDATYDAYMADLQRVFRAAAQHDARGGTVNPVRAE